MLTPFAMSLFPTRNSIFSDYVFKASNVQTEQLLPSQRSRTPSPRYSSVHGRNVSPPSPAERYPPRFRSSKRQFVRASGARRKLSRILHELFRFSSIVFWLCNVGSRSSSSSSSSSSSVLRTSVANWLPTISSAVRTKPVLRRQHDKQLSAARLLQIPW